MAYTVKAGDSLWDIAKRELGSGARWQEIAAANNISGTLIRPGQQLNIPGKTAPAPAPAAVSQPVTATTPPRSSAPTTGVLEGPAMGMPVVRDSDGSMGVPVQEERMSTFNRESYRDIVRAELAMYGLESLTDFVVNSLQEYEQIGPDLFMAKVRGTAEYKQRFRGNELRRQAGLNVLNESAYLADETAYQAILRNAGLPKGYYDSPDDFVDLIAGNVSPVELSARITEGYLAVSQADATVRNEMRRLYGLTDGEMVAYFLDPQKALPLIEREVATARVGAAAARQGFANVLDREALERMQSLGVSEQQAGEVFGTLAAGRELLTPLEAGETALDVADTALGLAGQSPEALQRLRTQQRRRTARFEGGGQLATTAAGVTGLREA
jgi:LysM repeat protein